MTVRLRVGVADDAEILAELVNEAGEGLPLYLWEKMAAPGETAWEVGRKRALREDAAFSWRNALIAEHEGRAAGCLIGYAIPDDPPAPDEMPALFVPLDELEREAPGSWYINVLAVLPHARRKGIGAHLVGAARDTAREAGLKSLSLIVSDANEGARRLYERQGFRVSAERPMVKDGWSNPGRRWLLMTRPA